MDGRNVEVVILNLLLNRNKSQIWMCDEVMEISETLEKKKRLIRENELEEQHKSIAENFIS